MSRLQPRRAALSISLVNPAVMPVGNLPGWTQVVAEDFNDNVAVGGFVPDSSGRLTTAGAAGYAAYYTRLSCYPDGWSDTNGNALYYPSKTLSTSASCADIYLHTESISGTARALAATLKPIRPDGQYKQTYGRFTYRMRSLSVSGPKYGCVALAIDSSNWPANGEFDWPEGDVSAGVAGFYHYANPAGGFQPVDGLGRIWSDWHVYTVEWSPNLVRWYVDGAVTLATSNQVPSGPLAWLIQAGSTGGAPDPATTGHLQIDWICIYDYAS